MHYFVTGASGFIGKRLVRALLRRKGAVVHYLMRPASESKSAALRAFWGSGALRAFPIAGDIHLKDLGLAPEVVQTLRGQIDHFYHLAAIYDFGADEADQVLANIAGTRNAVGLAHAIAASRFHHLSSIAAAGLYNGVFREDMFEEAGPCELPYFRTKHESEKIVRQQSAIWWTVYRPAMVVGDSSSGEMDKVDGPYYFF